MNHETRANLEATRKRLLAARAERLQSVRALTEPRDNQSDAALDGTVEAAAGRDQALIEILEMDLRQIDSALARVDEGSYGACANCESAIAPRRLEVLPFATMCVTCQAVVDHSAVATIA